MKVKNIYKYFCNLEKRNFVQKAMYFIWKDNGYIIHDSNAITKEAKLFYENLYASREDEIVKLDIRNHIKIQSLSQEQSNNLEGLITKQEVLSALKRTKNNKSPGLDGYTVEFFKFFFVDLGNFMVRSINCGFRKGGNVSNTKTGSNYLYT